MNNKRRRRLAQAVSTISQVQADARRQQKSRAFSDPAARQEAYQKAMQALEAIFKSAPTSDRPSKA